MLTGYSGVPAGTFGFKQKIEIGPMSGESNVIFWLQTREIKPTDDLVKKIFNHAKHSDHTLSNEDIMGLLKDEPEIVEKIKKYDELY